MSSSRVTSASIYREIAGSQELFKYNGTRLTLREQNSKPFHGMSQVEIDGFLTSLITEHGHQMSSIIRPGEEGAASSKFPTFVVATGDGRHLPIVFGYAYSGAETIQVSELSRALERLVEQSGGPVHVWNGREHLPVDRVIRRGRSDEKPDAVLCHGSRHVISISLKNLPNGRADQMQGWSGTRGLMGEAEVLDFADAVWLERERGSTDPLRCWRRITSESIRRWACWGTDDDPVHVIVAGSGLGFEADGTGGHRISARTAGGIWYAADGTIPDGPFEPALFCRPSADRSLTTRHGVIPGIRTMVATLSSAQAGRSSREI